MKIGKQIGLGFSVTVILLVIVSLWGIIGVGNIIKESKNVNNGNEIKGVMLQKEIDHLKWVSNVNALLTDEKITELDVETNYKECGLGKWYYGEGRPEAEKLIPALKPIFADMKAPHEKLHETAIRINDVS